MARERSVFAASAENFLLERGCNNMRFDKLRSVMSKDLERVPADYEQLLGLLKTRIRSAQMCAVIAVNSELVQLYWLRVGFIGVQGRED